MSQFGNISKILSLHCDEASELSSRSLDEPLPWVDRLALFGHLLACRSCRLYRRQLETIRASMKPHDDTPSHGLSQAAQNRIAQKLRDETFPPRDE